MAGREGSPLCGLTSTLSEWCCRLPAGSTGSVLNDFSRVTGLRVNWSTSQLFAIEPEANSAAPPGLQLQWVDEFTYLGVCVSHDVASYTPLNLTPVMYSVKTKLKAWENLSLSLLGCINVKKIKILPKFNYSFCNSHSGSPNHYSHPPSYKLSTLMWHTSQGGLALPDCYKYFIAAQLVTAVWWLKPDLSNPATILEATVLRSVEALTNLPLSAGL